MNIASIGIDLGKTKFHLVALDDHGKTVIKKKFSRDNCWLTRRTSKQR